MAPPANERPHDGRGLPPWPWTALVGTIIVGLIGLSIWVQRRARPLPLSAVVARSPYVPRPGGDPNARSPLAQALGGGGGLAVASSEAQKTATGDEARAPARRAPGAPGDDTPVAGGQTHAWWAKEIAAVRGRSDAASTARHALLIRRAEANGLEVVTSGDEVRVSSARPQAPTNDEPPSQDELIALAAELSRTFTVEELRLGSSQPRVAFARRAGETAALRIEFGAGAHHDEHRVGLTRVAQYALLAANEHERYESLALDLDRAQATLSIETGVTESAITLEAPRAEFDGLASRLIRLCLKPRLSAQRLGEAKARASGLARDVDFDALITHFASLSMTTPGFSNDPMGDPHAVREIQIDELENHIAGPMSPANATVVVAGGFDRGRIQAALASVRGGRRRPFERPSEDLPGTYHGLSGINVHLVAYPFTSRTPEELAAAWVATAAIEDRLFHALRAEGAIYQLYAAPVRRPWLDFILIAAPLGESPPRHISTRLEHDIAGITGEGLTDAALARNQRHVLESFRSTNQNPQALARLIAQSGEFGALSPKFFQAIAKMSRPLLHELASPWLDSRRAIHVELSPELRHRPDRPENSR